MEGRVSFPIVCTRIDDDALHGRGGVVTFPSRIFNGMVSTLTGVHLHDINNGFKAYRREVIEDTHFKLYGEFHRFVPVMAHWRGLKLESPLNISKENCRTSSIASTSGLPKNSALPGRALLTFEGVGVRCCWTSVALVAERIMKTCWPKIG